MHWMNCRDPCYHRMSFLVVFHGLSKATVSQIGLENFKRSQGFHYRN